MVTFTVLENLSMKILNPLIFMIFPWDNDKSSDNGQDIKYLLKKFRFRVNSISSSYLGIVYKYKPVRGTDGKTGFNLEEAVRVQFNNQGTRSQTVL